MIYIDLRKAVELVLSIVNEKPEGFGYRNVSNVPHGCRNFFLDENLELVEACLIGTAVHRSGVSLEKMQQLDLAYVNAREFLASLKCKGIISDYTATAVTYMRNAQIRQDEGYSWAQSHSLGLQYVLQCQEYLLTDDELIWLGARSGWNTHLS